MTRFKPKAIEPAPADGENPAVVELRKKKAASIKKIDEQMAQARRAAQAASAELNRARRSLDLLSENRKTLADTFDELIATELGR